MCERQGRAFCSPSQMSSLWKVTGFGAWTRPPSTCVLLHPSLCFALSTHVPSSRAQLPLGREHLSLAASNCQVPSSSAPQVPKPCCLSTEAKVVTLSLVPPLLSIDTAPKKSLRRELWMCLFSLKFSLRKSFHLHVLCICQSPHDVLQ